MRIRWIPLISLSILIALAVGCADQRRSGVGLRLPDGSEERGKVAFVELGCNSCHTVYGMEFPAPVADLLVPLELGGKTVRFPTDGEFVTSIINPSHELPGNYDHELVSSAGLSRMGTFGDVMTVQQLVDLVAFLQTRYELAFPEDYPDR